MKILIVSPKGSLPKPRSAWLRIPQLSLSILAALTPSEHEVVTVEEEFESLPQHEHWDVVAITAMTANIFRAYDLSAKYRKQGAKVILGGIHPSLLPEEAMVNADAVVVGEAEGIWPQVLDDVCHNKLESIYFNKQPDISSSPLPFRKKHYSRLNFPPYVMPVLATRGCPYDCEFCCVGRIYGQGFRRVDINRIIADISQNQPKIIMFLDDNIGAQRDYALSLFLALRPLQIRWGSQATLRFILDDKLFRAAVDSGLKALFVGVETIEPQANSKLCKALHSIEQYELAIKRCRDAGVYFHASMIFGLDEHTRDVFEHSLEFLLRNRVPSVSPNILTPYPGTHLFDRLKHEGRLLHTNWKYFDHSTVCYQPRNMSPHELMERHIDFCRTFFSWSSIIKRLPAQFDTMLLTYAAMNFSLKQEINRLEKRYQEYSAWLHEGLDHVH